MSSIRLSRLIVGVAMALIAAGCGGAAAEQSAPTSTAPATAAPSTTTTTTPSTADASTTTTAAPTTTAPTTTEAPATTTTQPIGELPLVESVVGGTVSGDGWLVEPGTYASEEATVPMRLGIAEPVAFVDGGSLAFGRPGVRFSQLDIVFFFAPVGITPAAVAGIHPEHDPLIPENTQELPDDLGAWFDAVPQITVLASNAGDGWRSWDVTADASAGETYPCDFGNCVATLVSSSWGPIIVGDIDNFRIWQFTDAGAGVIGFLQSDPATLDDTAALAEMLLSGLSFGN